MENLESSLLAKRFFQKGFSFHGVLLKMDSIMNVYPESLTKFSNQLCLSFFPKTPQILFSLVHR